MQRPLIGRHLRRPTHTWLPRPPCRSLCMVPETHLEAQVNLQWALRPLHSAIGAHLRALSAMPSPSTSLIDQSLNISVSSKNRSVRMGSKLRDNHHHQHKSATKCGQIYCGYLAPYAHEGCTTTQWTWASKRMHTEGLCFL
jgi:hypothetical protein